MKTLKLDKKRSATSHIELRDLQWTIVASQHRSFRQAANELNIRQSTLSRRLRDLELYLGVRLFERTNGGTRLTSVGEQFLESAARIVDETEFLAERLRDYARGANGRLTIGVQAALSAGNLRATLIDYRQRYPDVEADIVDGSRDDLVSALERSLIDVAFVIQDRPQWDDKVLPVWSERVVIALAADQPLAAREIIHWSDLKDEWLLLPKRGTGRDFLNGLISRIAARHPHRLRRLDVGLDRLLTLVGAGWGSMLALEGATGASYPGVVFREVHDADGPTRLNFYAYWRQGNRNPAVVRFIEVLLERYPDLSGAGVSG